MALKWIIEEGVFKTGNVECHAELAKDGFNATKKQVQGGGLFKVKDDERILYLFGKSYDFGTCTIEDVKNAKFHWRWDDFTVKFIIGGCVEELDLLSDEQFDYIREPIPE